MRPFLIGCIACALASTAAAESPWHLGTRLIASQRHFSGMDLTSPRVTHKTQDASPSRRGGASFLVGTNITPSVRVEAEYVFPTTQQTTARWAPFVGNDNLFAVRTQRLMLNVGKQWDIGGPFAIRVDGGLGWARNAATGWQGVPQRSFAGKTTNQLAKGLGVGIDARLRDNLVMEAGYRYVDAGRVSTGRNLFDNRAHARDEQLRANLREQSLYVGVRRYL